MNIMLFMLFRGGIIFIIASAILVIFGFFKSSVDRINPILAEWDSEANEKAIKQLIVAYIIQFAGWIMIITSKAIELSSR